MYFFNRTLVSQLIKTREQSFTLLNPRSKAGEMDDFVDSYLVQKIVPIWPSGWMKKDELRGECDKG